MGISTSTTTQQVLKPKGCTAGQLRTALLSVHATVHWSVDKEEALLSYIVLPLFTIHQARQLRTPCVIDDCRATRLAEMQAENAVLIEELKRQTVRRARRGNGSYQAYLYA